MESEGLQHREAGEERHRYVFCAFSGFNLGICVSSLFGETLKEIPDPEDQKRDLERQCKAVARV